MIEIITGDSATYAALAYGKPDLAVMDFCNQYAQQKFETFDPWLQNHLSTMTNPVFTTSNYQKIHNISEALDASLVSDWNTNRIRACRTTAEVQNIPQIMVEWVMACPELRTLYQKRQLAGYGEDYENICPEGVGEDHYFYRVAVEGLIMDNPDDDGCTATEWFDDLLDPTHNLTLTDQTNIQTAWTVARSALIEGINDPTSRFNDAL